MKITTTTIELTADDLKQMLDIIAPQTNNLSRMTAAPATLIEAARKLDKHITAAQPKAGIPLQQKPAGKIFIVDDTTPSEDLRQMLEQVSAPVNPTACKSKAVEKPTSQKSSPTTERKQEPASGMKHGGMQKGQAPACIGDKIWTDAETNLLRTCPTHKDAQFVYHSHFKDARNDNAIYQRWVRLDKAGEILHIGDKVASTMLDGKIGTIVKFTDDHMCANISLPGDVSAYQVDVGTLKKVQV